MVGRIKIADQFPGTHIRFRNIDDFESYINAIDQHYESQDAITKVLFRNSILLTLT